MPTEFSVQTENAAIDPCQYSNLGCSNTEVQEQYNGIGIVFLSDTKINS